MPKDPRTPEQKTHMFYEDLAAITADFMQLYNGDHDERFNGWIGVLNYLIHAAKAFHQATFALDGEPGEDWDWYLAVFAFAQHLHEPHTQNGYFNRGEDREQILFLQTIAARVITTHKEAP